MAYTLVNISKSVAPSVDITTGATTITFASAPTGWAASGDYPITITDGTNYEIALVTGGQGTATLTVTRAAEAISGIQTAFAFTAASTLITPGLTAAGLAAAVPAAASTVTGPDAFGAAAVVGTGTTYARDDHDHGLPSAPAPSLTSASSYITSNVSIPVNGSLVDVASVSLAAGTWQLYGQAEIQMQSPGSNAFCAIVVGPTSASATGAYTGADEDMYASTGTTFTSHLSCTRVVTLTSTTTVYLNVLAEGNLLADNNALAIGPATNAPNVTGLTAVKIA